MRFFALILFTSTLVAADPIWNRWTSENFVVQTTSNEQGRLLVQNLEKVKSSITYKWGFEDLTFNKETIQTTKGPGEYSIVKLWCSSDKEFFADHYGLTETKVRAIKENGKLKNIEAFILINDAPSKVVPQPITEIVLISIEDKKGVEFGYWSHRGIGLLNEDVKQIKANVVAAKNIVPVSTLFSLSKEDWEKRTDSKNLDRQAMIFCLFLRKEFGQERFLEFIKDSSEQNLNKLYHFHDYDQLDESFKKYIGYIQSDVVKGKTPDDYLKIKRAVK